MQEQNYQIDRNILKSEVVELLKNLIKTPSFSREEDKTCLLIKNFLTEKGIETKQKLNNVWAFNKYFDASKPTVLFNSHHDTVKPNSAYTNDPFNPFVEDGKLYGLGSNDAGGPLMSLLASFLYFYDKENLKYNFIFSATAEEEISGNNGVACILNELPEIDFAVVGEPTLMHPAIAEKGLMVLDCIAKGKAGHAAREEGVNAIYKAIKDIEWFQNFKFDRISETLGSVKMTATIINAGNQHNVVPAECKFTVDVRTTDKYTNEEVLEIIKSNISSEIDPRSFRLQPSSISVNHPFVIAAGEIGRVPYGSPTTSDQALMSFPSVKIGAGDSGRSHSANEFIYISEIEEAIDIFIEIFNKIC